jgi:hypothetical protein
MVTSRYIETGVLITFLLLIGFCTRIDPAMGQEAGQAQVASDVEAIDVKAPIDR